MEVLVIVSKQLQRQMPIPPIFDICGPVAVVLSLALATTPTTMWIGS